ncbi:LysR family transcriptional regulator [Endozoicomonas montiporae]|uniref:LysR family transcriptional regulator n=2 Tax=Endozoicomonas montiporae TaxID=1027273 RepID=A0A081N8F8_9GAMM|nr:LysR family transcriptional regulator [Endozoicomonas montiporae]AMO55376.1 LysR family transcriptional regulator [Endozoicomonas montiporae CL-33]KEQ14731.1 LysR family transcriptional regulator [Endozoicomonas montiporae]
MMGTDELATFLMIVEKGSFSAAAEQLGQTVSAVSRSLSRLEERLQVRLLTRTTRRLDLTEEGRWLLPRARSIVEDLQQTEQELTSSFTKPCGLIRVNASTPVLTCIIAPLAARFRKRYPDIRLELASDEQIIDLIEEQADMAIRVGELTSSTLNARRLAESRMQVVAAPAYIQAAGCPQTAEALQNHVLIGFSEPASLNLWPLKQGQLEGVAIRPDIACSNGAMVRELALEGAGIACASDFYVRADIESGRLVSVLQSEHLGWRKDIWAVFYKKGSLPARVQVFLDFLVAEINRVL